MPISTADLSALSHLLDHALALTPEQREAWLASLPVERRHLAEPLREMLAEHDGSADLDVLARPPALSDLGSARPHDMIGPYRLLRPIGQGGMGSVWLAEQVDGRLQRHVALKLPRLAWDERLAARMKRERDIGARLEHPHIARLYDAGVDELGRPFLALEYIDGLPIDTWCRVRAAGLRERLRLALQLAQALAYAHGRLVVHRDLKPTNVLVDAKGQAHLLDFGIARLLDGAATGDDDATQLTRAMTPHYAAPEQIAGQPVTVQSDIYSLGVLIYELLSGERPVLPARETPAAVEDAILAGALLPASRRCTDPATARALRGDLDAILAKALQREPQRRYATVAALGEDIERYLAGEPVLAQPDSWRYRLGKLVRRHRLGFALATGTLALLLGLAAFALQQADRARTEALQARQAAQRAQVVKDFVLELFKLNVPDNAEGRAARELPVAALLERGARQIESRFAGQPALQDELLSTVAQIMLDMDARELAVQYAGRLRSARLMAGAPPDAQAAAALLLARALRRADIDREADQVLADALAQAQEPALRAEIQLSQVDRALELDRFEQARQGLAGLRREQPTPPALLAARLDLTEADLLAETGEFPRAQPLFERAIAGIAATQAPGSRLAARAQLKYARWLTANQQFDAAEQRLRRGLDALRQLGGEHDLEAALAEIRAVQRLASTQTEAISYDAAVQAHQRALAAVEHQGPLLPPSVRAEVEDSWGCIELRFGRVEIGLALAEGVAKRLRAGPLYTHGGGCLGWGLMMAGRHADAETEFQKYLGHLWPSHGCTADCAAHTHVAAAHNRLLAGRLRESQALLDSVPAALQLGDELEHATRAQLRVRAARARLALEQGRPEAAIQLLSGMPDGLYMMNDAAALRAEAQCRLGQSEAALPALRAAVQARRESVSVSPWLADQRARLGLCAWRAGHRLEAEEMARLAHAAFKAQPGVSPGYKRVLAELDQALRRAPAGPR